MSPGNSTTSITPCHIEGIPAYRIENPKLSLAVIPELGGKIVSLQSNALQTEWLWKSDRTPYQKAELDHSYTQQHDTGGIDECFPSVDACQLPKSAGAYAGLSLPDHGELYGRPWEVTTCAVGQDHWATLTLKRHCTTLPCEFERTLLVAPREGLIEFQYRIRNHSDSHVPFSWCMHPALRIEPGMRLRLPVNHQLHCSFASDDAPLSTGDIFPWPTTASGFDLSTIPDQHPSQGFAAKLLSHRDFFDCRQQNEMAVIGLENPSTGETLCFELPPSEIPQIALWLNYHGWAGDGGIPYFNLVLEPAIGNADSLSTLFQRNTAPSIAPSATRAWSFKLRLT
ncbi:hypothetical protein Mag101_05675 [Microbulbifer agarilyticus]|uniref:Galactose mutarotase n=1 Tax=Microbulbifer agarilyticus TaxID=260552 RepID=A0A1Q2M386_9GAMM|nr:hypothetical protein [Microbulbifer agarilyticus]AQQ67183.1 hypothetical protein Mag101_05675 [Microbulbifer agarilyticus]